MNLLTYKNVDGTFTSPINGKIYKSEKSLRAHLHFRKSTAFHNVNFLHNIKINCIFCRREISINNALKHSNSCFLNPTNLKLCKVCNNPIKNFKTSKGTCSKSCANTYFRSGISHGNWKQDSYRTTCFLFHKKECIVCKERNIVEVHHLDEDNRNNNPVNLIPLCPTHHQYWHSKYRNLIEEIVLSYIKKWKNITL